MRGFKQHKKMYKSGKFWVVAGLAVVSLITANDTSKVFDLFSDRLGSVFAAQTNSSATIDTVTDADTATGGSRTVSWNGSSAWNYSDVTGLGSYNGSTWTGDRAYGSTLYKDPAGAYYTKLVANGASTAGYTYLTRQFDATKTFTVTGYLHPNVRDADQFMPRDYSDWTGLLLTPTDPNKIATAYDFSSKGGGGLGIEGMKNAYAFGIDFHKNTDKNDPAEGPFGALRTTNSSGTLTATQGKQSGVAGTATYTDGYNLSNWSSTIKYTLTWNPTGGPNGGPSIVATMTTNKTQNSESSSWTVDTAKAKVTLAPATALTVGLNAINGQNKNDQYASFDSMSGTLSTGTTTVKYVDANGNTIKDPTTFVAAVGDIIGISGLSSGAKAGTDDMAFAAPTIRGYTASSANDVTVSQTAGNNVITIKYKGTVQQEAIVNTNKPELWNGSSAITSYWNIDQTKPLGGSSLASSIVDASLVRSGYNYTVTDPNGSSYATMSAAYAAATNAWDSTANTAGVASDASPQNWTVNYTAQSQTAYLYTQNYTYDGSSYVTSGTASYMQGIYGPTDGSISFNTTDSALAKSGYTYTVQGPGGVTEYSTLASAQAIERFDNTNNSGSSDGSYQTFTVNYRPVTQTTSLVVDGLSPIKAGSTVASSVGTTSAALTIPYTDASLSTAGYTYVVKGPNGSTYSTLSSAVAANSIYDATNNSAATDSSAQVFTVSYIGQTQSAVIKYDPNGPLSAGTTFASTSGATNTSISFATNDGGLVRAGYTYTVTYAGSDKPDSVAYTTLSSALAAHPRYDSTAYAGTTDTSSQAFIVTYKTNQYANLITSAVDTSGNSLLNYSAISEIANGPASSTISFSNKDSQLAKSGYTYVVHVYDQMGSAASLLGTYTTLASAVAAQKYDNTQNATNARTDAYQQQFKVVYSPRTATVTYNFVDQSGKTISPATSATGPVGSNIPDGSKLIQGYTLISSSGDTDGKFDDDLVSTITYTYKAQYQAANVVVDSSSPIKMNSAVDSAAGVTSGSISFAKTDSQLAVSGYTYVVYAPNGSSYATLSAATAANNLYDNTENGSGSSDSSAQNFRVSYKANYQSAYIRIQQNSPINTGSMIESVTGVTDGSMTFSTTDSNLAVSGYTYQVGYGPDATHTTYYSTLAEAMSAAGGKFDSTNNTASTDAEAQRFVVNYIPMSQAAVINVSADSPISANSQAVMSANGKTGSTINFLPNGSFTTADSQLAVSGYTYTLTYGSDSTSYATLSAAVSAHNKYNANNTTSGISDANPDMFTITYSANTQSAVIAVTSTSPISAGSLADSASGSTSGTISFAKDDQALGQLGYTYTVTGPDGTVYSNLASALANNGLYDNTNNLGPSDVAVQSFMVSYSAAYQEARVILDSTGPYSSQSVADSASGVTSGSLGFSISDGDLALSGYHYTVWGRYGSRQYATLSAAVGAESSFDNTDNGSAVTDRRIQGFYVVYTADSQSAVVQVATDSPINGGQTLDSAAGVTSGSISFAANTENSLYSPGYHYTVTGPDGSTYSTLSSAVAANSLFDNTTNTGSIDGSVQSFMVSYTADSQIVVLAVDSKSPIDRGSVIDSVHGKTAGEIPFRGTDSLVNKPGYSYIVYYETNGERSEPYATLSAAQADHTTFDNTSNDGTSDADMQSFIISYVALKQQATIVGDANSPIYAGYQGPTTSGVTNGSMALPLSDGDLYEQGYSYVVTGPDGSEYATLSAASVANNVYDSTNNIGNSDADIQTFTVSYVAQYQSAALIAGSASNLPSNVTAGLTFASSAGVTSGRVSFATSDSDLARSGYRYTISTPDGTTFTTLSSALAGSTGLYDNTDNAGASDASAQQYTVNYLPEIQTARVIISETTGDEHAGEVLSESTGNTNEKISFTLSDGSDLNDTNLQKLEMTKGYTYTVIVEHPNGSTSGPYATLQAAYDDNPVYDDDKKGITTFIIVPQASYQEAVVNIGSAGTQSDYATSASGVTSGAINFGDLESSLAVSGYGYTVTVIDDDGNRIEYATLSAAVAAVGNYDNTVNGSNQSDSSAQAFDVNYTADYQSANVTFSGAPMSSVAFVGETSATLESTKFTADSGYYFDAQQPSYSGATTSVSSDGKELWVSFTYDDTNNSAASDSDPQNFEFTLQPATQQGNIMYSYSNAVSVPSDAPADESLSGKTGQPQSGTIKAPSGYYIAAINGDQYNVTYNDAATEAEYTLLWDDTPNGNAATDSKPQNLVVIFAPGNQRATVSQTMPGGTTTTVNTQNGRTDKDYSYEYTAPSGYYVADDGITTDGKGLISGVILSDGTTVTFTGKFDNNYTNYADENGVTDPEPQNTTIKLTASTQIAQFQIKVPDGATSVSQSTSTVRGDTGKTIEAPDGYTDEELNKVKGYTYTVTGPDGVVYNTMADALAANPNFDETNNGSSDTDAEMQQFVVNYKADQQTATITQQYADGAENTPAFPQANQTLTNGTDQITTGTITAPKGYKIDTVPQVAGMVWNIATDGSSATYTITFDVVADNDGASQAAVVTYVPVEQKVRVDLYDEVGRPLTDSQGKQ
ncbi:KxYKxGKxW signal peptide domain-containing protein [Weissella confusa]|uniref:KxYKxGKxW signal peptide domain-containing protein n=1 Tax=Weissella confusa TaxID=1583 RepID=UPI0022249899|nr:KxYKxGKxW signal peptide domain-containing protein [Weissella confusa]UYY89693.1 KxYKxGKxW signal peptide domain-containing protein [Weissella confusa]